MNTTAQKNNNNKKTQQSQASTITGNASKFKLMPISKIQFSPFNYRKLFSEKDLLAFADELLLHGIISPLTVRPLPAGNFELVAGERRLRAATIAGLTAVPVVINELSDDQVREVQLAENLQRENPHPLHEAFAIGQMQETGKKMDEIAARLGKSKQFIYSRLKLLSLIDSIQEMFLNDIINLQESVQIASVSAESQSEFFQTYCRDWRKRKDFRLSGLSYKLDQFKYDLKQAPFKTTDKKLVPDAGACNTCEHNTATLKSLFPDYAKEAVCNNRECYHKKCLAHLAVQFTAAFLENAPEALIFNGDPTDEMMAIIANVKGAADLPVYNRYDIGIVALPEIPVPEDYTSENETEDEEPSGFDETAFNEAMDEYKQELEEYNMLTQSGKLKKGLLVTEDSIRPLAFSLEKQSQLTNSQSATAKDVDTAIKAGTATVDLLEGEIQRLTDKEARAKQLDREKIQLTVHEQFSSHVETISNNDALTPTDATAARLLVYQSMSYHTRAKVEAVLFPESENDTHRDHGEAFYEKMSALTDGEYSYLIRNAMACQADGKFGSTTTGYFFYKQAEAAGINIDSIEHAQAEKASAREKRLAEKIKALETQITKLKKTAA